MYQLLNTLYVMTPSAYAHLENDTVRIDVDREKRLQVPLHHLGAIICFGNVLISPALIHRFADQGKSIVLLDDTGRFKARLEGPVSGNIVLRQAQFHMALDSTFALEFARAIVAGKLKNSRQVLLRGAREAVEAADERLLSNAAEQLTSALRAAGGAQDLDTLRGAEGAGARTYFEAFGYLIKPERRADFAFGGRSRRPPKDPVNALLSFLYSMTMNDCRSSLEAVGLDPQLGFLHAVRPGRASLALDLLEEFRAYVADRLALTLVNRGQLTKANFDARNMAGVYLNEAGRKTVVVAFQERKREELTHPLTEQKVPIGLLPILQARFMARTIRGELEGYLPFVSR